MHIHLARLFTLTGLVLFHTGLCAQLELHFDGTVPVERAGGQLALAWAGGLNYAQVGQLDLDQDGLKDLVFFDRTGNTLTTLINTGMPGTTGYRLSRAFNGVAPFDQLHDWVLLRDYNCDGKEDIFTYSQAGFSVYRNISTAAGLAFELLKFRVNCNYVFTDGSSQITNLYVSSEDLPGIVDVDGDGDLDVLTFSQLGSYVQYYKNLSLEEYGTCDSLKFELRNACWGRFSENASTNAINLNAPCPFQVPAPEIGGPVVKNNEGTGPSRAKSHAGSTVTPLDLNGDGVMDLLLGDISFPNLVGLTNGGSVDDSFMISVDNSFPEYDQPLHIPIFPAAFHLDVNKDGKRDLLVCPSARSLAQNFKGVWYYNNIGTDVAPIFEFQQEDLFQSRMLDFGEGAIPIPFDHNGDGLMDLLVANEGYFNPNGDLIGKIALLQNVGSQTAPAFQFVTDDYMNLSTSGIGVAMHPAFGDLDGDGDLDMYIGDLGGRLHYFRNTTTGAVAQFVLEQPNIVNTDNAVIDVGRHAAPVLLDLDRDGRLDLVVGEENGNLNYYRNTGTTSAPAWTFTTDSLGRVRTTDLFSLGHSVPFFFEVTPGQRELLVGSESGRLWHYDNIEGNLTGAWTLTDSSYLDLDEGYRTALCLYDFTGDQELDMVLGNYRGGLSFWRSDLISGITSPKEQENGIVVRPNPTTGIIEIFSQDQTSGGIWVVRNALGQEVLRVPISGPRGQLDLTALPDGMYLLRTEGTSPGPVVRVVLARGGR